MASLKRESEANSIHSRPVFQSHQSDVVCVNLPVFCSFLLARAPMARSAAQTKVQARIFNVWEAFARVV